MKKEKAAPLNGTTPTELTAPIVSRYRAATNLEQACIHLLENGMAGTTRITADKRHGDHDYRNQISDLRNECGINVASKPYEGSKIYLYWLPDRDQARKAAELVNHKRRQRGGAPLSQGQVASYLTHFPSTSQPQRG